MTALIANRTRPSLTPRIEVVPCQGKEVIAVEVPPQSAPVGTTSGRYLRRALDGKGRPCCLPMFFHEMHTRQADRGAQDYSALVIPEASWDDLGPLEFERFRRSIREHRAGDQSLLTLPDWPLLRLMEEFEQRFAARNREQEILVGMVRVAVPDYPSAAFREALANALIHRDYTRLGAVHVQRHDDRLEISNPGGFPGGVRLDNLLVTAPRPRNPLLVDAFKRAGIVERTARGIDTIFYEQLRNGRPAPSYELSNESGVVVVLPGGQANLDFVRLLVEEARAGRDLRLDELLLLNALWQDRRLTTWWKRDWWNRVGSAKDAPGTSRRPPIAVWVNLPPTFASAASSLCSRSRWCCSTWKSTGESPAARQRNYADSLRLRPTACSNGLRR